MNRCTEIFDAESVTTHTNSIAVVSPEKTEYFKAASKEEIQWLVFCCVFLLYIDQHHYWFT